MIRVDRFAISHRPFAVDLTSFATRPIGEPGTYATVQAVWFRRRSGLTYACSGELRGYFHHDPVPADAAELLARLTDGRYGGDCKARWDGTSYWRVNPEPGQIERDLALLRPMLAAYPAAPDGYDAWWRF